MSDVLTREQRRYCMSRIGPRDTKPELIVRRMIHAAGYRYRLHVRELPGTPDLVFPRRGKVIFVHGCFWHRHNCRYGRVKPRTQAKFWEEKLAQNTARDRRQRFRLRCQGWSVLTIWECQTKKPENLFDQIIQFLA